MPAGYAGPPKHVLNAGTGYNIYTERYFIIRAKRRPIQVRTWKVHF